MTSSTVTFIVWFCLLGTIEVEIHEDSDGYVTILGHRPTSADWQKSSKCEKFSERASQKVKKEEGQHRYLFVLHWFKYLALL